MRTGVKILGVAVAAVSLLTVGACKKKSASEKAAEEIGEAIEAAGEAVEEAVEDAKKEIEKANQ